MGMKKSIVYGGFVCRTRAALHSTTGRRSSISLFGLVVTLLLLFLLLLLLLERLG